MANSLFPHQIEYWEEKTKIEMKSTASSEEIRPGINKLKISLELPAEFCLFLSVFLLTAIQKEKMDGGK